MSQEFTEGSFNMSEERSLNLRDFIYLDVERVKSLLSQIDQGLLTDRSDSVGSNMTSEGRVGISIPALFDVGGAGQYLTTEQSIETRTLHDHVYNQTEERLLELDRVRRIPEDLDVATLVNSETRERISDVEYVLATGKVVLGVLHIMVLAADHDA